MYARVSVKNMNSKKDSKYNPISAGVAYTFGNMLIKAIPFFTLPIFTRILSTSDFGLYNTYLAYESIISILLGLGLSGTIRVAKVEFKEDFERYISSIYGIQIIFSFVIDIVAVCVFARVGKVGWVDTKLLIILLANCLCTQLYNIASAKYAINGEVTKNLGISFLLTFANVGISLLLCMFVFVQRVYLGRILGTCIAEALVALIVIFLQIRENFEVFNTGYWKFGLIMGAPLILHSLSLTLLSQCDKIMIQSLVGDSEAGIYSIAVTLTGIVSVLVGSIDNAWAPWFFKKLENRNYGEIYRQNNNMIVLFSMLTILIMLISPELIRIISAAEYWESTKAFPMLLISVLFNFYYLIPVNFEYFHKKTSYIAFSTIVTAIINVLLNLVFIRLIGYIGAAYATCISKFILLLMHWVKAWKLDPQKLMGIKEVIGCTAAALMMSIVVILCDSMLFIRYSLIAVMLFIAFIWAGKQGYLGLLADKIKKY